MIYPISFFYFFDDTTKVSLTMYEVISETIPLNSMGNITVVACSDHWIKAEALIRKHLPPGDVIEITDDDLGIVNYKINTVSVDLSLDVLSERDVPVYLCLMVTPWDDAEQVVRKFYPDVSKLKEIIVF